MRWRPWPRAGAAWSSPPGACCCSAWWRRTQPARTAPGSTYTSCCQPRRRPQTALQRAAAAARKRRAPLACWAPGLAPLWRRGWRRGRRRTGAPPPRWRRSCRPPRWVQGGGLLQGLLGGLLGRCGWGPAAGASGGAACAAAGTACRVLAALRRPRAAGPPVARPAPQPSLAPACPARPAQVGEFGERLALLRAFLAQLRFELAADAGGGQDPAAGGGEVPEAAQLRSDLAAALANLARYYGQFEGAVAEAQQAGLAPIQKVRRWRCALAGARRACVCAGQGPARHALDSPEAITPHTTLAPTHTHTPSHHTPPHTPHPPPPSHHTTRRTCSTLCAWPSGRTAATTR
jgi:hypothetical protein